MAEKNLTLVTKFLLMAFIDCPEWALPLFLLFLFIYLITLLGNLGMIILIRLDLRLHTSMYFLLSHLSFMDTCYSFATVPLMMAVLLEPRAALSYTLCAAQFFLFTFFGSIDCYLLALMANDLYVAVCQPLLYVTIMRRKARLGFVCITCGDIYTQEVVLIVFAIFVIPACIVVISVSYLIIVLAIMRIPSAGGRAKTFWTCATHLTAVSLFFGTLIFMYLRDNSSQSSEEDRVVSVFYITVIPTLNPLVYSLRNKEVMEALRNILSRARLS
ncbi:hypothetical protein J1605_002595 [Eschrichtius robustus]|uniref:G-protein coupled receptors family 1 profile domain-containing protein n=1 Tax=Eschrichtius robustus TaxID=9764 RepID=A0AB34HUC7_ESCRO|nr:hypothetical protein J1605_002595 [Eschrichtius robustus]